MMTLICRAHLHDVMNRLIIPVFGWLQEGQLRDSEAQWSPKCGRALQQTTNACGRDRAGPSRQHASEQTLQYLRRLSGTTRWIWGSETKSEQRSDKEQSVLVPSSQIATNFTHAHSSRRHAERSQGGGFAQDASPLDGLEGPQPVREC